MAEIKFDDLPESKETQFLKTAGVNLGYKVDSIEFVEAKTTPAKGSTPEKTSNPYVKVSFKSSTHAFTHFMFQPPILEENVKYFSDLYENGIKIRKRNAKEMIELEFQERFYFYEQLARAWNAPKEKIVAFRTSAGGDVDGMFRRMYDKFVQQFTKDFYRDKKINFKTTFRNDDKKRTSNLQLCKAEARNVVMAAYINDTTPVLELSDYEEQNSVRKYKPQERKPENDNADAGGDSKDSNWKPAETSDTPEADLF